MHPFLSNSFIITLDQVTHLFSAWMVQSSKQMSSFLICLSPTSSTKTVRVTFPRHHLRMSLPTLHDLMASYCSCEERQVPYLAYSVLHSLFHPPPCSACLRIPLTHRASVTLASFQPITQARSSLLRNLAQPCPLPEKFLLSSSLFSYLPSTPPSDFSSEVTFSWNSLD